MPTLGVAVFSLEGMRHLNRCLKSVAWADEVLLFHAGAGEPETAGGEFPSLRVRKLNSMAEAEKHWGEIKTDWVLHLWADERLEGGLIEELQRLCREGSPSAPLSYRIAVRSFILGEWAEGSVAGPGPSIRLSRRAREISLGWWMKKKSAPALGRGWIGDYGCSELSHAVERVQELSDFWAASLGAMAAPPAAAKSVLCSLRVFIRMLLLNRIFSRGLAGLTLSALASYAVLLSGAKLWEAGHAGAKRSI